MEECCECGELVDEDSTIVCECGVGPFCDSCWEDHFAVCEEAQNMEL